MAELEICNLQTIKFRNDVSSATFIANDPPTAPSNIYCLSDGVLVKPFRFCRFHTKTRPQYQAQTDKLSTVEHEQLAAVRPSALFKYYDELPEEIAAQKRYPEKVINMAQQRILRLLENNNTEGVTLRAAVHATGITATSAKEILDTVGICERLRGRNVWVLRPDLKM